MNTWSDHHKQDGQISEPWTIALPYIHRKMKFVIVEPSVSPILGGLSVQKTTPKTQNEEGEWPPKEQ